MIDAPDERLERPARGDERVEEEEVDSEVGDDGCA